MVGGDVVTITTTDATTAATEVREAFQLEPVLEDGTVRVEVPDAAVFMPQLFANLSVPVTSVASRRPSLDDVFLKLTGHAIRDEGPGRLDQLRQMGRIWSGRR